MPRGQTGHIEQYHYPSAYGQKTTSVKLPPIMHSTTKAIARLLKGHSNPEEILSQLEEYARQLVEKSAP